MNTQKMLLYVSLAMGSMFVYERWVSPRELVSPNKMLEAPLFSSPLAPSQLLTVTTPNARFSVDPNSSRVVGASLLKYKNVMSSDAPVEIFETDINNPLVASLGLEGEQGAVWTATHWGSEGGALVGRLPNGLVVEKHYSPTPDGYSLRVKIKASNPTLTPIQTRFAMGYEAERRQAQVGASYPLPDSFVAGSASSSNSSWFSFNTFAGLSFHDSEKSYTKLPYSKLAKQGLNKTVREPWLSIQKRYFVTAIIPSYDRSYELLGQWDQGLASENVFDQRLRASLNSMPVTLAHGEATEQDLVLYAGPEDAAVLKTIAPHLDLTIDFGIFWILCEGLLWVLQSIYSVLKNWGLSIVFLTFLLRLVFYSSSQQSYRSMQKMKMVGPKAQALQVKYKDDETKKNQAVMQLYREEGINPLSGCLPALLPFPFMAALYYVLLEAIQLRHVPFLWLPDLAAPDPLYILPVAMAAIMYVQQSLTPVDDSQKMMMGMFPLVIGYMSTQFPSGLALFYFVNTLLGFLQQWWFTKRHSA